MNFSVEVLVRRSETVKPHLPPAAHHQICGPEHCQLVLNCDRAWEEREGKLKWKSRGQELE